jgi:hypothetical protein
MKWLHLDHELDEANNYHPNIKLTHRIDTSLPFLDVLIENKCGILTIVTAKSKLSDEILKQGRNMS